MNTVPFVFFPTDTRMETASPAAALAPIDTSPSHTTPLNCAQEDKQPVEKMASSTLSVPAKEKVGDFSVTWSSGPCELPLSSKSAAAVSEFDLAASLFQGFFQVFIPPSGCCVLGVWEKRAKVCQALTPLQSPGFQVSLSTSLLVACLHFHAS